MDPMDDIADPSDFTLFTDVITIPDEMKRSPLDDKPTIKASSFTKSFKNQTPVQNHNPKYQNKLCYNRNYNIKKSSSPHVSHNDSLQRNHTIVKSTLANEMLQQNPGLMSPTEVKPGILGVNQVLGTNNQNSFIPESKAPQELLSTMSVKSKCGTEVIKGNNFTLYPPKISILVPRPSEKAPNCKTVWVGGLPKKYTENIIHEIFGRFGKVEQVLMKSSFSCCIRYISEEAADKAIAFSGYNLVIQDSENADNSGLIFVDFSQSRSEEIARKEKQISQKRKAPITNSCTYTDLANAIKKIKSNNGLLETLQEITSWIIRGDCNKCNAVKFYDIMDTTFAAAKRLQNKKGTYKMSAKINQIQIFFGLFYQPKVWCYFTVPQKKKIDIWKAEIDVMKSTCDDLKRIGDCDDEPSPKKIKLNLPIHENDHKLDEIKALKSENIALKTSHKIEKDELKKRLETTSKSLMSTNYELMKLKVDQNKMEVAKTKEIEDLGNEIGTGQNKLLGLERELEEVRLELDKTKTTKDQEIAYLRQLNEKSQETIKEHENNNKEFNELKNLYKNLQERYKKLERNITVLQKEKSREIKLLKNKNSEDISRLQRDLVAIRNRLTKFKDPISLESARLIGLVSSFLLPFCVGAHLNDILAYIRRFHINITKDDLESLMSLYYNVFKKNSDGNWILNMYNTTEPPEDKKKHPVEEPLERMSKIVDSLAPPPTSISGRKNIINNHKLNTSSNMSNSRSSPGTNLVKDMKHFLEELVPLEAPLFNNKSERRYKLNWYKKKALIHHIVRLPLNSVWSETVQNAILFLRPYEVPLTENYRILVKLRKTFRTIDIPPTTEEKMDSLNHEVDLHFLEERELETNNSCEQRPPETISKLIENIPFSENESNEPIKCSNIVSKRSTDNSLDCSATTSKKKRCDGDLRKIEYRKVSATGDLNTLLNIYNEILKAGEYVCVIPSESVACSQEFVFSLKNMFKHLTIITPLLNQIKDDDENLTKTFSVLSVEYYDYFKNILSILPCFGNSDISKVEPEEPKLYVHAPPRVRAKVILKHADHVQSFIKQLKIQFEHLIEVMKVEHKVLVHYERFVANTFKYFNRLDIALNQVARTLGELVINLKANEMSITADKLKEMLVSAEKKNLKFETAKDSLALIANNIKTLRSDISNIWILLSNLKYNFYDIMKGDYYDHLLIFKDHNNIVIIEHIFTHFSGNSFSCERVYNISLKKKTLSKKCNMLIQRLRSTSMMVKTIITKIQQINSPRTLGTETFNDCKDIFDCIIKYLSNNINESTLAFISSLELLIKNHEAQLYNNYKNIDSIERVSINPSNSSVDKTSTREFTGKLDELRAMFHSYSGTKSFVLSVAVMQLLEKIYLGVENVYKFVPILNSHLSSIKEFIKDFIGEDIDKHFSILSDEYFEVIENIFNLFLTTNFVRTSSRNDATFKDAIGCANYVKEIITSLEDILKVLEADLMQLKSEYSCGNGSLEMFESVQKFLLNLSQSLSIFLFAVVKLTVLNKENVRKFSGSLEELYNLYKSFSENTDSSVLRDRKEINLSVLPRIGLMISVRQQFSTIRLLLDSLEVELNRLNYDKKYKECSSLLCDEYFSIFDGFIKYFPESLTKKIELSKIQENKFKIVHEPMEKRVHNLELQVNEAINHLNEINLEGFPWEINKFADSKDFLESFVVHLLNSLDFLRSIRFLSRYLSESLFKESDLNEQQLDQPTIGQLTVKETPEQNDLSTAEHSLSHNRNQVINLISTKKLHCDKESINDSVSKISTQNNKKSSKYNSRDTENQPNEIVNVEQSGSFDTEKSFSFITNQINKIILNQKHADNLKEMYEAYQFFKTKLNIQFPTDRFDVIDEDFCHTMSRTVCNLTELHMKVMIIRGLVSVLKDDPNYQQELYILSEDYFIIFNEFFYGFLLKGIFKMEKNYDKVIKLKLGINEFNHSITFLKHIKKIYPLLLNLEEQFQQIRNITIEDKYIFSKCQKFFKSVLQYFKYLNNFLKKLQDFLELPINKNFFHQIHAECNNEFPIKSRIIENKYLICFTDTLNTQEDRNITIEKEQEGQIDLKPVVFCNTPKKETANDFAKTTQKLRNELQELFEDSPDSKQIWNNFEGNLDHHVGADQC